jgi:hypothetical protein
LAASIRPPQGGKPDKLMRDAIMVALKREATGADGQPTRKLYLIADKLVDLAVSGDMAAIKEVNDRVDGKAVQAITGANGGAIATYDLAALAKLSDADLENALALHDKLAALAGAEGGAEATPAGKGTPEG